MATINSFHGTVEPPRKANYCRFLLSSQCKRIQVTKVELMTKNDCTLSVKAAEDIVKGKKEGVLKRKREREERKQLKIINSNKPKKLKMKKKPAM